MSGECEKILKVPKNRAPLIYTLKMSNCTTVNGLHQVKLKSLIHILAALVKKSIENGNLRNNFTKSHLDGIYFC